MFVTLYLDRQEPELLAICCFTMSDIDALVKQITRRLEIEGPEVQGLLVWQEWSEGKGRHISMPLKHPEKTDEQT